MEHPQPANTLENALMRGPRGRRLLLGYAIVSDEICDPAWSDASFRSGVSLVSRRLDPDRGSAAAYMRASFGWEAAEPQNPKEVSVSAEELAERLAAVSLARVTPELLRRCLAEATESARYWQEPDGSDVLAALPVMLAPLQRVAAHIAASADAIWWSEAVKEQSQWTVNWEGWAPQIVPPLTPLESLRVARDEAIQEELVAISERPSDPTARWSGTWWSCPPWPMPASTGGMFDGSPAGLWFVEDSHGWEQGEAQRLGIPAGLRIYEIDTAEAWASLCAQFPLEVTAQKRHDWYRTTGRAGTWVVPDWARVAEHYDAVHLQVRGYLSAAGTAIPVGEHTASVIAGWNPDQTYWFTPRIRSLDERVGWAAEAHTNGPSWRRDTPKPD